MRHDRVNHAWPPWMPPVTPVNRIRAKLLDLHPAMQTAPPGERRVDVDAVTPAELAAALAMIRRVRPLPLAFVNRHV